MHVDLSDGRRLGRQTSVQAAGSRLLSRICRLCGGRQGGNDNCDNTRQGQVSREPWFMQHNVTSLYWGMNWTQRLMTQRRAVEFRYLCRTLSIRAWCAPSPGSGMRFGQSANRKFRKYMAFGFSVHSCAKVSRLPRSKPSAAHSSRQWSVPWSAYVPGFTNLSVIRSDSPIARYLSRSLSPSPSVGGRVHTPSG